MAQQGDAVSNAVASAKAALSTANKKFPSSMAPKSPAAKVTVKANPAPKAPSVGDELAAKSDNVNEYMAALPKMHKGGPVMADGAYILKAGEHVLTASEAGKARQHALAASGMKSLAKPAPKLAAAKQAPAKPAAKVAAKPAQKDNNSMSIEGANVVDKTEAPGKIPPAPRSPLAQDDAYHSQRVTTI
jgi:hypothetical protein